MSYRQDYLERAELRKQCRLASGLVSEQFPEVSGIVIRMTYYQRAAIPILMVRNVNFSPSRHTYFKVDCMVDKDIPVVFSSNKAGTSSRIKSNRNVS
jgi:hypothetical protein